MGKDVKRGVLNCTLLVLFGVFICIESQPVNDVCSSAIDIYQFSKDIAGTTAGATYDFPGTLKDSCGNRYTSGLVWYKVRGNGNKLRATTCSGANVAIDTSIYVFEDSVCQSSHKRTSILKNEGYITTNNPHCVVSNDDAGGACASNDLSAIAEWCSEDGKVYLIAVGNAGDTDGSFAIRVENLGSCFYPSLNDKCENAKNIKIGQTVTADLVDATIENSAWVGMCAVDSDTRTSGPGVWYKFKGNGHILSINTHSLSSDSLDFTYRVWDVDVGNGCNVLDNGNAISSGDMPPACVGGFQYSQSITWVAPTYSTQSFATEEDANYVLFVEGHLGSRGSVKFSIDDNLINTKLTPYNQFNIYFGGSIPGGV